MTTTTTTTYYPLRKRIVYPETDGKPMAESDFQRKPLAYVVEALDYHFRERPDVYVSGNLLIYYEEGSPEQSVAPDVFVVFGVPRRERPSYFVWKEGKGPDMVLEITSRTTRSEDQGPKRGLYAMLGVREYFQYDPTGDYLLPALQGGRLSGDHYAPIAPVIRSDGDESPGGVLALRSEVLNVEFRLVGGRLVVYDPASGQRLLTYSEAQDARRAAEEGRLRERSARLAAETELARLRDELARLKGE